MVGKKIYFLLLGAILCAGILSGCEPVKQYQKQYLNDEDMLLQSRKSEIFNTEVEVYREGAAGANGGKTGGGCGCN